MLQAFKTHNCHVFIRFYEALLSFNDDTILEVFWGII